jgi:hypothetical protein
VSKESDAAENLAVVTHKKKIKTNNNNQKQYNIHKGRWNAVN